MLCIQLAMEFGFYRFSCNNGLLISCSEGIATKLRQILFKSSNFEPIILGITNYWQHTTRSARLSIQLTWGN